MGESKLNQWLKPETKAEKENVKFTGNSENPRMTTISVEEEHVAPKKQAGLELLKEEIIGDVKVVMRRNTKLKYLEIRAYDLGSKKTIEGKGFAQYLPPWKNEYVDGPKLAEEYFQALVTWFKGGRKGSILPFRYSEGPWHEEKG